MTITTDELRRMFQADDLARAAGLDPNKTPREYNDFCARAEEEIRAAERRGREES